MAAESLITIAYPAQLAVSEAIVTSFAGTPLIVYMAGRGGGSTADGGGTGGGGTPMPQFPEWKVGDSITKVTTKGDYPSWTTIRSRYWRNRVAVDGASFAPANRAIMAKGFAPKARVIVRDRNTGEIKELLVEKEIHHAQGNSGTPGYDEPVNLQEVWPWEHEPLLPPGRR